MSFWVTALIGMLVLGAVTAFARPLFKSRKASLSALKIGDFAPDFELKNFNGKSFKLSSYRGQKPVVVFFYPSDNTPGCTAEVCAFQRLSPDFSKFGAEVFGISSNGAADKEKFIVNNKVTSFELLIDEGNKVRRIWGVPKAMLGMIPGRVTYVLSKEGKVVSVFDDLLNAATHPEKALEALGQSQSK